jgi:hypothetical protein
MDFGDVEMKLAVGRSRGMHKRILTPPQCVGWMGVHRS